MTSISSRPLEATELSPIEVVRYEPRWKSEWDAVIRTGKNGSVLFLRDYVE